MILTATRGQDFEEPFNFKDDQGHELNIPIGSFSLTLERGSFVRQFDLSTRGKSILWRMTADETKALEYDSLYFVLFFDEKEVTRGVLRVK